MIEKFESIKNMGWIKTVRKGPTGVGATFEHCMGITENRVVGPDYENYEIKTKRMNSDYYTTLFNLGPRSKKECTIHSIRDAYGYKNENGMNVFNTNVFGHKKTPTLGKYWFQLYVNYDSKIVTLLVFNKNFLVDTSIYWKFEELRERLENKCSNLAFIESYSQMTHNVEYFRYSRLQLYKLKSFNEFLKLIDNGTIKISFKISVYNSGAKKGETHDHGTGFEIKSSDFEKLYTLNYDSKWYGTKGDA